MAGSSTRKTRREKLCIFAGCGRLPQSAYHEPCSRKHEHGDYCSTRTCHPFRSPSTRRKLPTFLPDRLVGKTVTVELRADTGQLEGGLRELLSRVDLRTDEERLALARNVTPSEAEPASLDRDRLEQLGIIVPEQFVAPEADEDWWDERYDWP